MTASPKLVGFHLVCTLGLLVWRSTVGGRLRLNPSIHHLSLQLGREYVTFEPSTSTDITRSTFPDSHRRHLRTRRSPGVAYGNGLETFV